LLGYLEWPAGLLSGLLGDTAGHPEPVHFISPLGAAAALLGLAGFALSSRQSRETGPERPGLPQAVEPVHATAGAASGWVSGVAEAGLSLAGRLAAVHTGQLGRYVLFSVLGIAVILLIGLRP
jgi:hypothetical protein